MGDKDNDINYGNFNLQFGDADAEISEESVREFIAEQSNKETKRKTDGDIRDLSSSLIMIVKNGDYRAPHEVPHNELELILSNLIKSKGLKPNASDPLDDGDIDTLLESGVMGTESHCALLHLLFYNNTLLFGMRSTTAHYKLKWGDVELSKDDDGRMCLLLSERQTKNRSGAVLDALKRTLPKAYENSDSPLCPVKAFNIFRENRPQECLNADSPFYIQPNYHTELLFNNQRVGINKIRQLMKIACKNAGIIQEDKDTEDNIDVENTNVRKRKLTNSSIRKSLITDGIAITGHRRAESFNDYAPLPNQKHAAISKMLSTVKKSATASATVARPISTEDNDDIYRDVLQSNLQAEGIPVYPMLSTDQNQNSTLTTTNTLLEKKQEL